MDKQIKMENNLIAYLNFLHDRYNISITEIETFSRFWEDITTTNKKLKIICPRRKNF